MIAGIASEYTVPEGEQRPGVETEGYRAQLKHKADVISRSQYEVCSFSTKHNFFSEAAVDELLGMLSNVSISIAPWSIVSVILLGCVLLNRSDSIPRVYTSRL